jgi:hypothetical protein
MHGIHVPRNRFQSALHRILDRAFTDCSRILDQRVMKFSDAKAPFVDTLCCCDRDHRSNFSSLRTTAYSMCKRSHYAARLNACAHDKFINRAARIDIAAMRIAAIAGEPLTLSSAS